MARRFRLLQPGEEPAPRAAGDSPDRFPDPSPDPVRGATPRRPERLRHLALARHGRRQGVTDFKLYTRSGSGVVDLPYEKTVLLPELDNRDPRDLWWADARFLTDILAEHMLFATLFLPPELAPGERQRAAALRQSMEDAWRRIDAEGPPAAADLTQSIGDLRPLVQDVIDFKRDVHRAQEQGSLRTLAWPLFWDHTRHEAERGLRRLEDIHSGHLDLDRREVVRFWGGIMEEHARLLAHMLDPDEADLVSKAMGSSAAFRGLASGGPVRAFVREPGAVVRALVRNPEGDAVLSAAEDILDFKTDLARRVEGNRVRGIVEPRLADHVRREAVKFVDELRRSRK